MGIVRVFEDCDMRNGITGFEAFLRERKIAVDAAGPFDMFMFVNPKKNQIKILWGGRSLFTYRKELRHGEITLQEIYDIPKAFGNKFIAGKAEPQLRGSFKKNEVAKDVKDVS